MQHIDNVLHAASANSIGAGFIFLQLLKREVELCRQPFLTKAKHDAPRTNFGADILVEAVGFFLEVSAHRDHSMRTQRPPGLFLRAVIATVASQVPDCQAESAAFAPQQRKRTIRVFQLKGVILAPYYLRMQVFPVAPCRSDVIAVSCATPRHLARLMISIPLTMKLLLRRGR